MLWFLFADGPTGFVLRRVDTFRAPGVFSPGGRFALGLSSSEEGLALWDVEVGQVGRSLEGTGLNPVSAAFSSDGTRVLAQSTDGIARLWNVETGQGLRRATGERAWQVAVWPEGQLMALAGGEDHIPIFAEIFVRLPPLARMKTYENNTIKIRNLNTGAETACLRGHTDSVAGIAFSPDGRRLLSGSFDGTMRLWDVATAREVGRFQRHTGWVTCVAFCPDGRRAVAGYYDWSIRLWDLETGQELRCFDGHHATITALAVAPDGHSFLSGGFDGAMRLWDLDGGVQRCVFRGDKLPLLSVSFSAEGRSAVSWCMDGTMRVWEPKE
jgi:WD40 repeat protein